MVSHTHTDIRIYILKLVLKSSGNREKEEKRKKELIYFHSATVA